MNTNQWIKVSEKLPKESGEYLAYNKALNFITILFYFEPDNTLEYDDNKLAYPDYWTNLPEPPNGD